MARCVFANRNHLREFVAKTQHYLFPTNYIVQWRFLQHNTQVNSASNQSSTKLYLVAAPNGQTFLIHMNLLQKRNITVTSYSTKWMVHWWFSHVTYKSASKQYSAECVQLYFLKTKLSYFFNFAYRLTVATKASSVARSLKLSNVDLG